MTNRDQQVEQEGLQATPGGTMAPHGSEVLGQEEDGNARRRVLNLLSRHPELVAGNLDAVATVLCEESALALGCERVGIWRLGLPGQSDWLVEQAFSGMRFEDLQPRRVSRRSAPAFFAAMERRRLLHGRSLHELSTEVGEGIAAVVHAGGEAIGLVTFQGASDSAWGESEFDFALLVAEMVGRCLERNQHAQLGAQLERVEGALGCFSRMVGDALCFEVVEGQLVCQGDPRLLLGVPPAGQEYEVDFVVQHMRPDERELVKRRFGEWAAAGAPGVISARFHYSAGQPGPKRAEIELDCRLMRQRGASGARLWGVLRRAPAED